MLMGVFLEDNERLDQNDSLPEKEDFLDDSRWVQCKIGHALL